MFSHQGELVPDPFVGSGTTLVAAQDCARNAVGFDLQPSYVELARGRIATLPGLDATRQVAVCAHARHVDQYVEPETVALIVTSPPYANLLNRRRRNKSRRGEQRGNEQYLKVEQYSQDARDLGTLDLAKYSSAMAVIFGRLLPLLRPRGHCVVNVPDMWWENRRVAIHIAVVEALESVGYELRNIMFARFWSYQRPITR